MVFQKGNKLHRIYGFKKGNTLAKLGNHKGSKHSNWKGGVSFSCGYRCVWNSIYGVRKVCWLVVESYIGRLPRNDETVHHVDGDKLNDSPTNLMLFINRSVHTKWHSNPNKVKNKEIVFDGRKLNI